MIFITPNRRPPPPVNANQAIPTVPPPTSTPTPTLAFNPSQFRVQVLNSSGVTGRGASVSDLLSPLGLTQITVTTARTTITGNSQVTFTPGVPVPLRELIVDSLRPLLPDISIKELPEAQFDIVVNIAKTTP